MTDFYSVLKTSIIRRDLRSSADRLKVYDQAREAMIRKLLSFDPPLAEDEIETRIGLFDAAVEKIERDLERAFSEPDTVDTPSRRRRPAKAAETAEPHRQPLVVDGYDEDADYVPAFGGQSSRRPSADAPAARNNRREEPRRPPARDGVAPQRPKRRDNDDDVTFYEPARLVERPATPVDDRRNPPKSRRGRAAPADLPEDLDDADAPPLDDGRGYDDPERFEETSPKPTYRLPARRNDASRAWEFRRSPADPQYEEPAYDDAVAAAEPIDDAGYRDEEYEDPNEGSYSPPARRRAASYESQDQRDDQAAEFVDDDYEPPNDRLAGFEPAANDRGRRRDRKAGKSRGTGKKRKAKAASGGDQRNPVRMLVIVVASLAVILIGFNAYILLPILFDSPDPVPVAPIEAPAKIDDRMPVSGLPGVSGTRIPSDSATATEIPERNLDVAESLVVFDGRDPTVFEGSSNNPIQFDSDLDGGFARISSAASAAGARAVIGPGLADRLAGQTIRVTLLARSSDENGATGLRFAYQSGLAVSHWQSADLSPNYSTFGMIWRVPATHTAAGDYLLIEPGIPGDGTGTDIRSIKIDVLAT